MLPSATHIKFTSRPAIPFALSLWLRCKAASPRGVVLNRTGRETLP